MDRDGEREEGLVCIAVYIDMDVFGLFVCFLPNNLMWAEMFKDVLNSYL